MARPHVHKMFFLFVRAACDFVRWCALRCKLGGR